METIEELILFATSILPVFLVGLYIYKKDKQKESASLLAKLFLGGIGACFLAVAISLILEPITPTLSADPEYMDSLTLFLYAFFSIALVEEFSKWVFAFGFSYNDKNFDEFYDAIIYCTFVALGFACFENLFYVYEAGIATGLVRGILSVPSHACDGIFMGYHLGLAKMGDLYGQKDKKSINLVLSILVPTVMHGLYDYCLLLDNEIFLVILFIFVICMYVYAHIKINKTSAINRKMKYKDNFCPNCGRAIDSDLCPICGRKND